MSSPFVIPFDYNPESVTVMTGSYTIPSGKYARVKFFRADATINATNVFHVLNTTWTSPLLTNTDSSYAHYVTDIGGILHISGTLGINTSHNTASFIYLTTQVPSSYDTVIASTSVPSPLVFSWTTVTTTSISVNTHYTQSGNAPLVWWLRRFNTSSRTYTYNLNIRTLRDQDIWVPSGTVLNCNSYLVQEYNQIS